MRRRLGRRSTGILSAILIGGLAWCGWRWREVRHYRHAIAEIDDAMRHGRYTAAARDLSALLAWSPGWDKAVYLRGLCEKARGQPGLADATWAAIPPDSVYHKRAMAGRTDLLIDRGRLADAEKLVLGVTDDLGLEASALRMILIQIFVMEGRPDDAERLIESRWRSLDAHGEGDADQAVNLARLHMELRWNVPQAGTVREYLDRVGRLAPDDDRVWLGRANLALRTGASDDARRWIDACLERNPDDQAVWRARLNWSVQTNAADDAMIALEHLPAGLATTVEGHRVSAWMASRRGDVENERHELATLVAQAPEDFVALERLDILEKQQPANIVAESRRRPRAEIERDQRRYRELYRRNQPLATPWRWPVWLNAWGGVSRRFSSSPPLWQMSPTAPNCASLHRLEEVGHDPPPEELAGACSTCSGSTETANGQHTIRAGLTAEGKTGLNDPSFGRRDWQWVAASFARTTKFRDACPVGAVVVVVVAAADWWSARPARLHPVTSRGDQELEGGKKAQRIASSRTPRVVTFMGLWNARREGGASGRVRLPFPSSSHQYWSELTTSPRLREPRAHHGRRRCCS